LPQSNIKAGVVIHGATFVLGQSFSWNCREANCLPYRQAARSMAAKKSCRPRGPVEHRARDTWQKKGRKKFSKTTLKLISVISIRFAC